MPADVRASITGCSSGSRVRSAGERDGPTRAALGGGLTAAETTGEEVTFGVVIGLHANDPMASSIIRESLLPTHELQPRPEPVPESLVLG